MSIMFQRLRSWLPLLALLLAAGPAAAQALREPPDLAQSLLPDYARRDLRVFADVLRLDEDQQIILQELFRDYESDVREGSMVVREALARNRRGGRIGSNRSRAGDDGYNEKIRALMQEYERRRKEATDRGDREAIRQLAREIREKSDALKAEHRQEQAPADNAKLEEAMAELARAVATWKVEKDRLSGEFIEGARAILNVDQLDMWPRLERRLTRMKKLGAAVLAGEGVDLVAVARALDLDDMLSRRIATALEQYELELHEALVAREAHLRAWEATQREVIEAEDRGAARRFLEEQMRLRTAVRDVNGRYAEHIAGLLPEPASSEFAREAAHDGHARIFGPTRAQRAFRRAVALSTLDPGVRESIEALEEAYLSELGARNQVLVLLYREHEPADVLERELRRLLPGEGRGEAEAPGGERLRTAFQERSVLGNDYMRLLADMLTDEQKDQLERFLPTPRGRDREIAGPAISEAERQRLIEERRQQAEKARGVGGVGSGGG